MAYEPNKLHNNEPITSYGILLFHVDETDQLWYLSSQRRDTIEYTDYLRGRYVQSNLEIYFKLMTPKERKRLSKYTFDELWDDLWVNHNNGLYRDSRAKAKAKYETNTSRRLHLLENTESSVKEPGWGFPKGKRNYQETEIECAYREFKEETKMPLDYLNLLNLAPSIEVFKGSNSKMYRTVYYISQVDHKIPIRKITHKGIRTETVSEEVSNLLWGTIEMLILKLPAWRKKLLVDSETKIKHYLCKES